MRKIWLIYLMMWLMYVVAHYSYQYLFGVDFGGWMRYRENGFLFLQLAFGFAFGFVYCIYRYSRY